MGAANCNNAIAGMYRAMATLVTVLSLVVVLAHAQKDATPEVLLSQLPDGFSYQDTDDVTSPDYDAANLRGQDGLSAKLKAAHADEAKERRKADGLQGEMVLSSVGIKGGARAPDDPTSDNFDDLELVQVQDSEAWPRRRSAQEALGGAPAQAEGRWPPRRECALI